MKSVKLRIDNRDVEVPSGATILDAARELKIHIPALCHLNGFRPFTSCMVCVVLDIEADRLVPSCSAPVTEGMRIETENERIVEARKDALDFLLSEHVGDCEAPCNRACPARMDIPQMIRQIKNSRLEEAIATVKEAIALPAVLGRICPAPCEKGCHRGSLDSPVSICSLKRHVADIDLAREFPFEPDRKPESGCRVAVVGAGPAGLAAAYYLRRKGHACHIFDRNPKPGGMLRYGVPNEELPESVLDAEVGQISALGAELWPGRTLGRDLEWKKLRKNYDAIILALGKIEPEIFKDTGIGLSARGIEVDRITFQTSVPGVFAGGNAVSESRSAVRAVAHGRGMAFSADQFLSEGTVRGPVRRFQSRIGRIRQDEAAELLKEAAEESRVIPQGGPAAGLSEKEAVKESSRCFGCDCRKQDSCRLRLCAEEYQADSRRFVLKERKGVEKVIQHDRVIYEPGKCIKCGLCVRITEKAGERLGLTFVGRGFEVRVETPFGEELSQGLEKAAAECVGACPTGALSWRGRP